MSKRGEAKSVNKKRDRSEDDDDYLSDDGSVADGSREKKSKLRKPRVKANAAKTDEKEEIEMWEVCLSKL